jgi:hypothetical protein
MQDAHHPQWALRRQRSGFGHSGIRAAFMRHHKGETPRHECRRDMV